MKKLFYDEKILSLGMILKSSRFIPTFYYPHEGNHKSLLIEKNCRRKYSYNALISIDPPNVFEMPRFKEERKIPEIKEEKDYFAIFLLSTIIIIFYSILFYIISVNYFSIS